MCLIEEGHLTQKCDIDSNKDQITKQVTISDLAHTSESLNNHLSDLKTKHSTLSATYTQI